MRLSVGSGIKGVWRLAWCAYAHARQSPVLDKVSHDRRIYWSPNIYALPAVTQLTCWGLDEAVPTTSGSVIGDLVPEDTYRHQRRKFMSSRSSDMSRCTSCSAPQGKLHSTCRYPVLGSPYFIVESKLLNTPNLMLIRPSICERFLNGRKSLSHPPLLLAPVRRRLPLTLGLSL